MKIQGSISRVLALRILNARIWLASLVAELYVHMRLMTRSMYAQISALISWFSTSTLQHSVVEELVYWQSNLGRHIGGRICFKSSAVGVAYSDASDTGYGGYIVEFGPQLAAQVFGLQI